MQKTVKAYAVHTGNETIRYPGNMEGYYKALALALMLSRPVLLLDR